MPKAPRLHQLPSRVPALERRREPHYLEERKHWVYKSQAWREARLMALVRARWHCQWEGCEFTRKHGRLAVDHRIELRDGGAPFQLSNLWVLCPDHHAQKTQQVRRDRMLRIE